jgi:hypothetical protein
MHLAIYRSVMRTIYPEETLSYCYAFQPIPEAEQSDETHLLSWTDESGPEPFAVVDIPEGASVTQNGTGWYLQLPECPYVLEAERVYEVAVDHSFGLSIILEARDDMRKHYFIS